MSTIIADPKDALMRLFDYVPLTLGNRRRLRAHIFDLPDNPAEWNRTALGREARRVLRDVTRAVEDGGAIHSTMNFHHRYYATMFTTTREVTQMLRDLKPAPSRHTVPPDAYFLFEGDGGRPILEKKLATRAEIEAKVRERVGDKGELTISETFSLSRHRLLAEWNLAPERRRLAERAGYPAYLYEHTRYVGAQAGGGYGLKVDGNQIRTISLEGLYEVDASEVNRLPTPMAQALMWDEIRGRILNRRKEEHEEAEKEARRQARAAAEGRYSVFRKSLPKESDMLIPTLPIQGRGTASSRRWGIEIETGAGRDLRGTPPAWDSKGDGSLESAYGERYIPQEECYYAERHDLEDDDEDYIDPHYCEEHGYGGGDSDSEDCVELVSPILTSFHSRGLEQICEDLEHAPRSESAGIHVHVEAKDLTPKQIRNLILIYDRFEPLIESSYDREVRGYCKLRSTRELLEVVRSIDDKNPKSHREFEKGDRYVTVNLWSLDAHGTVEFRAMGPRYNYDHLIRWAMFCREIVNAAGNGATPKDALKVKDWNGLLAFFRKFGTELNRAESTTDSVLEEAVSAPRELVGV